MPDVSRLERPATDRASPSLRLGQRIRKIRIGRGLTLDETSRRGGVSKSALSKLENERVSPTFEVLERVATGLGVPLVSFFTEPSAHTGRLTWTGAGQGKRTEEPAYNHEFLCTAFKDRRMVPFLTTVKARSTRQFDKPASHNGEEFLYVLAGEIAFVSDVCAELRLSPGDSLYFDSRLGHLCYSLGEQDATLLWVWCDTG